MLLNRENNSKTNKQYIIQLIAHILEFYIPRHRKYYLQLSVGQKKNEIIKRKLVFISQPSRFVKPIMRTIINIQHEKHSFKNTC